MPRGQGPASAHLVHTGIGRWAAVLYAPCICLGLGRNASCGHAGGQWQLTRAQVEQSVGILGHPGWSCNLPVRGDKSGVAVCWCAASGAWCADGHENRAGMCGGLNVGEEAHCSALQLELHQPCASCGRFRCRAVVAPNESPCRSVKKHSNDGATGTTPRSCELRVAWALPQGRQVAHVSFGAGLRSVTTKGT